jgi:hypothetical protein
MMTMSVTTQEQRRGIVKEAIGLMKEIHSHIIEEDSRRHQKICCCRKIIATLREEPPTTEPASCNFQNAEPLNHTNKNVGESSSYG